MRVGVLNSKTCLEFVMVLFYLWIIRSCCAPILKIFQEFPVALQNEIQTPYQAHRLLLAFQPYLLSLFTSLTLVLCPPSMQVHFLLWPLYSESPLSVIFFLWTFKCLFQVSDQMSPLKEVFTCLLLPSHHIRFHYSYCLRNTRPLSSNWSVILKRAWLSCLVHWLL